MNSFRSILRRRTDKEDQLSLYNVLMEMEKSAHEQWLAQMGVDNIWNQTGYPHLIGIERNIDQAVPSDIKEKFSNTEIFILLASVLLHDIGKLLEPKNPSKSEKRSEAEKLAEPEEPAEPKEPAKPKHYQLSCKKILEDWPYFKIPKEEYAKWIAVICCSHGWKTGPKPLADCSLRDRECCLVSHSQRGIIRTICETEYSELDLIPTAEDGPVRLKWIAALLRLGDETENNQSRSAADFTKPGIENKHSIWRHYVNSVEFNLMGNCIVFHIDSFDEIEHVNWHWMCEGISNVNEMLGKNGKPSGWRVILQEIGIDYQLAFVQIQLPTRILLDEEELGKIGFYSDQYRKKHKRLEEDISDSADLLKEIGTLSKQIDISKTQVCACSEPIFERWPESLNRICTAINRIDQSVIIPDQSEFLTIDMLAYEAGIPDVEYVEMALKRIIEFKKCLENNYTIKLNDYINFDLPILIKNTPELVISYGKWKIIRNYDNCDVTKNDVLPDYISTGIEELNNLLFPDCDKLFPDDSKKPELPENNGNKLDASDRYKRLKGGFFVPKASDNKRLVPIVVIEGSSGEGKTTLSLQIAANLASEKNSKWCCLYFSLEQDNNGILQQMAGHDFFQKNPVKRKTFRRDNIISLGTGERKWYELSKEEMEGKIILPKMSCDFQFEQKISENDLFEIRYRQLEQALKWIKYKGVLCFCFIDSLSAFSSKPLTRGQTQRVFSLFRNNEIPLMGMLERRSHDATQLEQVGFHAAKYLADIVISIESRNEDNYFRQYLSISKSRYTRRILGDHLVKMKSPQQTATKGFDDRLGLVVYRSIHNYLVQSRDEDNSVNEIDWNFESFGFDDDVDRESISDIQSDSRPGIQSDSCLVVSGPMGGHKFALAMNLLLGIIKKDEKEDKDEKEEVKFRLIVSFAEEKELKLDHVAFFEYVKKDWSTEDLEIEEGNSQSYEGRKIILQKTKNKDIQSLHFRIGNIMPEEFLYIFSKFLDENKHRVCGVLFADTAQLRTRFPLLAKEPLFLPALVDIVKSRGLLSIFIDVTERNLPTQSLLAAADYRIFVERDERSWNNCIRLDNIRGKDYDRSRKLISIDPNKNKLRLSRVSMDTAKSFTVELNDKDQNLESIKDNSIVSATVLSNNINKNYCTIYLNEEESVRIYPGEKMTFSCVDLGKIKFNGKKGESIRVVTNINIDI